MTRVAFYLNMFLIGGIETSLIRYLKALDKNRFDVTLVIGTHMKEYEVLITKLPPDIKVKYILRDNQLYSNYFYKKRSNTTSVIDKVLEVFIAPLRKYVYHKRILAELSSYDVVVDYAMGLIELSHLLPKRLIGFFHFSLASNYLVNSRKTKLYNANLNGYNKLIVLNQSMYNEFLEYFEPYKYLVQILYNQFDFNEVRQLSEFKVDDIISTDYMISVGRLEENQKDFTTLIYAFAKIQDKISTDLIIIGDGTNRDKLQELIDTLDLSKRVFLYGHKANPFPYIKHSRFFVFSSKYEGLPTVLIEAMILGRAVISSDCPTGPYEITNGGKCGLLFKVGDVEELAQHMYHLINNQLVVDTLVSDADMLLDRFNINSNIKQLEELIG